MACRDTSYWVSAKIKLQAKSQKSYLIDKNYNLKCIDNHNNPICNG